MSKPLVIFAGGGALGWLYRRSLWLLAFHLFYAAMQWLGAPPRGA